MDWTKRLKTNENGLGDPVTALYLPEGFVVATSFPLAGLALRWIARLTFGEAAERVTGNIVGDNAANVNGLREISERFTRLEDERQTGLQRYDTDVPKPLIAGLRVHLLEDSLQLHAFRTTPFGSSVTVTVRPHLASRDGSKDGPPLVGVEWKTVGPGRDEAMLLPETLGAPVRNNACSWPDTTETGLTSVVFRVASHMPLPMPRRWSLRGLEWPHDRGGIVCFGKDSEVGYLVTLPRELASPLVRRVGDGSITLYGGEHYYLDDRSRSPQWQKF